MEKTQSVKMPKWYLIVSLLVMVMAAISTLGIRGKYGNIILDSQALLFILFGIFNFIFGVYFLAKQYKYYSLILPISLIIFSVFVITGNFNFVIEFLFSLMFVGYILFLLWKE